MFFAIIGLHYSTSKLYLNQFLLKKPLFKSLLSYLTEIVLEESSSEYNAHLQVLLTQGRYQLCTEDAIYSFDDKYDNFLKAFKKIDIKDKNVDSMLLLGLGLGSIPFMLENIFKLDINYTAVEIDEEICRLAEKYVLSDLQSPIMVYPIDANHYFSWYNETFDLIAMDIFDSATIPLYFESEEYLQILESRLNENGIILYNRLADSEKNIGLNKNFNHKWKKVFPIGGYVDTGTNHIFLNDMRFIP